MEFPQVVDLNVGGRHLTTSLATLTIYPESVLGAMFSGRHHVTKDKDGRYFIDVNGDLFVYILDFLRLQILPPPEKASEVKKYSKYFGIEALSKCLDDLILSSQDAMFAQWASNIPGFSKYLHQLKHQLTRCDIKTGFIYLQLSLQPCSNRDCNHEVIYVSGHDAFYERSCSIINVPIDVPDENKFETLFTLFSYHLSKVGFHVNEDEELLKSRCKSAKKFVQRLK